jgi:hypothetical protein
MARPNSVAGVMAKEFSPGETGSRVRFSDSNVLFAITNK